MAPLTESQQESRLDEAIRREALLDAIFDSMADGLIMYSTNGEILQINRAAKELLGYGAPEQQLPLQERLRRARFETISGEAIPRDELPAVRAFHGQTVLDQRLVVRFDDGRTLWGSFNAAPARNREGEQLGAVVSITDIGERIRAEEALREKDGAIRRAYSDVIEAVTGGKLVLMTPDEIEASLGTALDREREVAAGRLTDAIGWLWETVPREFPSLEPAPMIDAVGEALTNAVKHAQSGTYRLYRKDGGVQVRVTDQGPGIDFAQLPKATLQAGYSTVGTLGRGFDTMLKNCDRLLLSTQPGNTTLVLEIRGRQPS